jgi:hypothetical protein
MDWDGDGCDDLVGNRGSLRNYLTNSFSVVFGDASLADMWPGGYRVAAYRAPITAEALDAGDELWHIDDSARLEAADLDGDGYDELVAGWWHYHAEQEFAMLVTSRDQGGLDSLILCAGGPRPGPEAADLRGGGCRPLLFRDGQPIMAQQQAVAADVTGDGVMDLVVATLYNPDDSGQLRLPWDADDGGEFIPFDEETCDLWGEFSFDQRRGEADCLEELPRRVRMLYGALVLFEGPIDPHGSAPLRATAEGWSGAGACDGAFISLAPGSGRPGEPVLWVGYGSPYTWQTVELWDRVGRMAEQGGSSDHPFSDAITFNRGALAPRTPGGPPCNMFKEDPRDRPDTGRVFGVMRMDPEDTRPVEHAAGVVLEGEIEGDLFGYRLEVQRPGPGSPGYLAVVTPDGRDEQGRQVGLVDVYALEGLGP